MTTTPAEPSEVITFDWSAVIAIYVHPMRVAIIETLSRVGEPLSTTDLRKIFGGKILGVTISRHIAALAKVGVLEEVRQRHVRGATEKFYFFPESLMTPPQK